MTQIHLIISSGHDRPHASGPYLFKAYYRSFADIDTDSAMSREAGISEHRPRSENGAVRNFAVGE